MALGYIVYVDILLLYVIANFLCDYLLLWATAAVTLAKTNWRRLCAGAAIGTLHFLLLYLASLRIIPYYGLLRFIPTILAVTLLMLLITFHPVSLRRLVKLTLHFAGIGFGSGGIGLAAAYLLGTPAEPNTFLGLLAAIAGILVIAEIGWGVVQTSMIRRIYQLPIRIYFGDEVIRVVGLLDTGNHLTDPLTGAPVIVLEQDLLTDLLPADLAANIQQLEAGDEKALTQLLAASQWSSRFRIIPYSSLGSKNGILVGFRPDKVTLDVSGQSVPTGEAIVAICNHQLDNAGEYRALIPPSIVHGTLGESSPSPAVSPAAIGGEGQ
ncbi:MAG: sigma-E processing peptidase SpoIIGA [Firmicutes bacterium]|nr:sigma-E processing peptidase SpoIIGA [Bacillota bacterium]